MPNFSELRTSEVRGIFGLGSYPKASWYGKSGCRRPRGRRGPGRVPLESQGLQPPCLTQLGELEEPLLWRIVPLRRRKPKAGACLLTAKPNC